MDGTTECKDNSLSFIIWALVDCENW